MKGWAIAQNDCPMITKANPILTSNLITHPKNVIEAPITTPFFIPFTSRTQLEGKFIKTKNTRYDIGINATHDADTSNAF